MKKILSVVTLSFFISCETDINKSSLEKNTDISFPIIQDTSKFQQFKSKNEKQTWLTTADYDFYYIGKLKDTLLYSRYLSFIPPPPPPPPFPDGSKAKIIKDSIKYEMPFKKYYVDWMDKRSFKNWNKTKIEILVDTTIKSLNSYPVLITNKDVDTTYIGYGNRLPMIMEAIDSTGVWRPIQEKFTLFCGTGVGSIILPPNEIVLTFAPIFKGNYKTKLRLTIDNNYSKTFTGFINHRQFESRFNEYGEYKKEYKKELKDNAESTTR